MVPPRCRKIEATDAAPKKTELQYFDECEQTLHNIPMACSVKCPPGTSLSNASRQEHTFWF